MKNQAILLIAFVFIAFSCNGKSKADTSSGAETETSVLQNEDSEISTSWAFDTLSIEKRVHIDNDAAKSGVKIDVSMVYPISAPKGIDLEKVQNTFAKVFSGVDDFRGSPKDAFETVVANITAQGEEYARDWEEDWGVDLSHYYESKSLSTEPIVSDFLISVSTAYSTYAGGAHGSHNYQCNNIDVRDGSVITESDLFVAGYKQKLTKLIQGIITDRNNSKDEDSHINLLVELSEVVPNGNFQFAKDGLTYFYNQYEITAYAYGIIEITVPYEKIRPLVKPRYVELIDAIQSQSK